MAKKAQYSVVDSKESFEALLTRVRQAQQEFARYSQERAFFAISLYLLSKWSGGPPLRIVNFLTILLSIF